MITAVASVPTSDTRTPDVLVPLIQQQLDHAASAIESAGLPFYRAAGELLLEAKAQLKHGAFRSWISHHFTIGQRQAQTYMRLVDTEKRSALRFCSLREVERHTVDDDAQPVSADVVPLNPRKKPSRTPADAERRRDKIARLAATGATSKQIAARVHLEPATVSSIMRKHGIDCPGDRVTGKHRQPDSVRIFDHIISTADSLTKGEDLIDFDKIQTAQLADAVASLRASHAALGRFIARLAKRLTASTVKEG